MCDFVVWLVFEMLQTVRLTNNHTTKLLQKISFIEKSAELVLHIWCTGYVFLENYELHNIEAISQMRAEREQW